MNLLRAHRLPARGALGGFAQGLLDARVAEGVAAGAAGRFFYWVEADGAFCVGEGAGLRARRGGCGVCGGVSGGCGVRNALALRRHRNAPGGGAGDLGGELALAGLR